MLTPTLKLVVKGTVVDVRATIATSDYSGERLLRPTECKQDEENGLAQSRAMVDVRTTDRDRGTWRRKKVQVFPLFCAWDVRDL